MEYINKVEIQGEIGKGLHINKSEDKFFAIIPVITQEEFVVDGETIYDVVWHKVDAVSSNDIPKVIFESLQSGKIINVRGKLKAKRYEDGDGISVYQTYIVASKIEIIK